MVELISVLQLLLALFLVALNGLFVAAEFAFVRIRPTRVTALVEEGRTSAKLVKEAIDNLDGYLAVCQLGITIASLSLGWIGEPAIAALIEPVLGLYLSEGAVHTVAVILGFGTITFLHVVFGELAPKTFSIQDAETISLVVAPPMKFFYYLFLPGIIVFNGTANYFTSLVGYPPVSETEAEEAHTSDDIRVLIAQSQEQGHVAADEHEMIEGIFDLRETVAREVMVPRPDVVAFEPDMPLDELLAITTEENYTSYPVLDPAADEPVIGVVLVEDVVRAVKADMEAGSETPPTARTLARDVLVVAENRRIDEILTEFQTQQIQMAVVIDEWGAVEGIVTLEDIVEQIVGDIRDRFDEEEPSLTRTDAGGYTIDGRVAIQTVNEALQTDFESEDFETIGGLVLGQLGRAPAVDDQIVLDGYTLHVADVDGTRITHVIARDNGQEVPDEPQEEQREAEDTQESEQQERAPPDVPEK
jgi:CBS domain containing-hemolysin-like protein